MKFFLNGILAIIILIAGLFGLYKTGVITFYTANNLTLSWTIEGTISDMPIEEDVIDDATWVNNNSTGSDQEEANNYLTLPYPDTAEVGVFSELGKTSANKTLYSYKVKLGGNIGGVENKWEAFTKWSNLSWVIIIYKSYNGNELTKDKVLSAWEIVYVETNTMTETISETSWTTMVEKNETTNTYTDFTQAKTCVKYVEFFECVLSKVSGVDPDIIRNNLNALIDTLGNLSPSEQDAKCTKLIYEVKVKSSNATDLTCISIIK